MTRPARVLVNTQALRNNLDYVRRRAPRAKVMAIVKADGYGHGVVRAARALVASDAFGVASLEEAKALRAAGITNRIVLLGGPIAADEIGAIKDLGIESVVHNFDQVALFSSSGERSPVWLKVDTGMHRLGFDPSEVAQAYEALAGGGRTIHLMTHFYDAHSRQGSHVPAQLRLFEKVTGDCAGARCAANSAAILAWPQSEFEWVRPGLMLYGVSPFSDTVGRDEGLQPAMTLASALISIRDVAADGSIGYGGGYRCPQDMAVGVVAFGYGDGYPRHAGTGTPILVNGIETQVLGEASMDMLTVDLRPIDNARIGDPVVLWGEDLPVERIANRAATIPYELLCRVRMRARYVDESR